MISQLPSQEARNGEFNCICRDCGLTNAILLLQLEAAMEVEVGGNWTVDLAGTSLLVVGQMSFTVLGSLANNIVLITVKVRSCWSLKL